MTDIVFVHGMFQNPKSWNNWLPMFSDRGYRCHAPAWPLHEGEPAALRANPPAGLGELSLDSVLSSLEATVSQLDRPIMIGHSVGGLITQIFLNRGLISAGVAISSVAPNAMLDFDWGFIKNSAIITNPVKGDDPVFMDRDTFYGSFANTLIKGHAFAAYDDLATHDSRNVLRDCMGASGRIDLDKAHGPLLLIGGEKDEIIPSDLVRKNYEAYPSQAGQVGHKEFRGCSHFICNEPGWENVAEYVLAWLAQAAPSPVRLPEAVRQPPQRARALG